MRRSMVHGLWSMVRIAESPLRVAHPFEVRDAIVVLGAPLRRDGSLSRALRERV